MFSNRIFPKLPIFLHFEIELNEKARELRDENTGGFPTAENSIGKRCLSYLAFFGAPHTSRSVGANLYGIFS